MTDILSSESAQSDSSSDSEDFSFTISSTYTITSQEDNDHVRVLGTRNFINRKSLELLISQYQELARFEEQQGCFLEAEIYWKKGLKVARQFFPKSGVLATTQIETGLFFSRLLRPELSETFLCTGLSLREFLESDYADRATLSLAKLLISLKQLDKAAQLLQDLSRDRGEEMAVAALAYRGVLEMNREYLCTSEVLLRTSVEKARTLFPDSSTLVESFAYLGEVLLIKELFVEAEGVLLEGLAIAQRSQDEGLLHLLCVLSLVYETTNRHTKLDEVFEGVLAQLRDTNARPYYVAEVLSVWGDAYRTSQKECAALHYLQALHLYESVKPSSGYVVRMLLKLMHISYKTFRCWTANVQEEAIERLSYMPTLLDFLAFYPNYQFPVVSFIEEIGKAPLAIKHDVWKTLSSSEDKEAAYVPCYLEETSRLLKAASNLRKRLIGRRLSSQLPTKVQAEVSLADCDDFLKGIDDRLTLQFQGTWREPAHSYQKEARVLEEINPCCSRCVFTLMLLSMEKRNSKLLHKALLLTSQQNLASDNMIFVLSRLQTLLKLPYARIFFADKALDDHRNWLRSVCPAMNYAFFEKVLENVPSFSSSEYILKKALVFASDSNSEYPFVRQLRSELKWFLKERAVYVAIDFTDEKQLLAALEALRTSSSQDAEVLLVKNLEKDALDNIFCLRKLRTLYEPPFH